MVDPEFRNVICPWQTESETRAQERFVRSMLKSKPPEDRKTLLGLDKPDRIWRVREGLCWDGKELVST